MSDLTLTRSGELEITQVEGKTEAGIEFVDGWIQEEMTVADAGRILVRDTDALILAAGDLGLTIEMDKVEWEKSR